MRRRVARRMRAVARCVTRPILNPSTCQRMDSRISDSNGVKSIEANNVSTANSPPSKAAANKDRVAFQIVDQMRQAERGDSTTRANRGAGVVAPGVGTVGATITDAIPRERHRTRSTLSGFDVPLRSVGQSYP